jgi:hypothetical protein
VLLLGVVAGLLLGLVARGRVQNLLDVRLRWTVLIIAALLLRFGTQGAIANDIAVVEQVRLPLFGAAFGVLATALWANRAHPGMLVAAVGVASNMIAITANGGWMPVWAPALESVGLSANDLQRGFHQLLPAPLDVEFLLRAGPLGDIVPFPVPFLRNVGSIGDVFVSLGLGWFVFATLVRGPAVAHEQLVGAPRIAEPVDVAGLDRPVMLGGGRGPGTRPGSAAQAAEAQRTASGRVDVPVVARRLRHHPYVSLALDARFSAFWLGQTLSLFGDRLHQVALGVLVLDVTDSALATGLVFLVAALPNLVLGPIAGTFVDRWITSG